MPTYLYTHTVVPVQCHLEKELTGKPSLEFEVHQNIKDDALEVCLECGNPVKRLIAGNVSVTWKSGAPTPKNYR